MQQIGSFIVGHWELFVALAVILFLLARTWIGPGAVSLLMPTEAIQLINHKNALVVDVRTDKEYQQGHVMNSLHIPLGVLDNRIAELQAYKASPMVMVCRSGARSGQAASKLKKQGFTDVHNLGGGMLAWERANLPVTTKTGVPPKPMVVGEE
jgi:rhodanese-related sulfurtransferase